MAKEKVYKLGKSKLIDGRVLLPKALNMSCLRHLFPDITTDSKPIKTTQTIKFIGYICNKELIILPFKTTHKDLSSAVGSFKTLLTNSNDLLGPNGNISQKRVRFSRSTKKALRGMGLLDESYPESLVETPRSFKTDLETSEKVIVTSVIGGADNHSQKEIQKLNGLIESSSHAPKHTDTFEFTGTSSAPLANVDALSGLEFFGSPSSEEAPAIETFESFGSVGSASKSEESFLKKNINRYLKVVGLKTIDFENTTWPVHYLSTLGDSELEKAYFKYVPDRKYRGYILSNENMKSAMIRLGFYDLFESDTHLAGSIFETLYAIAVIQRNYPSIGILENALFGTPLIRPNFKIAFSEME